MNVRAPALAAVVVATLVVGVTTRAHSQVSSFFGVAHSAAEADQRAQAMLDRTYLLGAVRVEPPVSYRADHPHQYEVQDERWLSVGGTPIGVTDTIDAHPPAGFVFAPATELFVNGLTSQIELRPVGQQSSLMHVLDVTATAAGKGRVLVLVQAIVAWVPPRTAAETIPPDVMSGDLTSGFGDSPDEALLRHRTLTTAEVRALATALNARPTTSPYSGNACAEGNLGLATLTLPNAIYQIDIGTCGQVQVQVGGVTQPNLAGGAALSSQIGELLGTTSAGA